MCVCVRACVRVCVCECVNECVSVCALCVCVCGQVELSYSDIGLGESLSGHRVQYT